MKSTAERKWLGPTGLYVLGFAVVLWIGFHHLIIRVDNGGRRIVQVKPPSFFASLFGSECSVAYLSGTGKAGAVRFYSGFFEFPSIVFSTTNNNHLYCLYDFDVGMRLVTIDTTRPLPPLALANPSIFAMTNELGAMVDESTCLVRAADEEDWDIALSYLQKMPSRTFDHQAIPLIDLGFFRIHQDKEALLRMAKQQLRLNKDMQEGRLPRRLD